MGAFVLYAGTAARHVGLIDSGELMAVAMTGGVAHPTGYPLFTLIAYSAAVVIRWLGSTPPAVGLTLLSSLPAAAACTTACVASSRQASRLGGSPPQARLVGILTATGMAVGTTLWSAATEVEVYALTTFLLAALLALGMEVDAAAEPRRRNRLAALWLYLAGLSLGNHMSIVAIIPMGIVVLSRLPLRRWVGLGILGGLAATVTLQLPLRAAHDPLLEWGNPETLGRWWHHIQGAQYQVWMFTRNPEELWASLREFADFLAREDVPMALAACGLGLVVHRSVNRAVLGLAGSAAFCVLYTLNYEIPDIRSYLLPAIVSISLGGSWGLTALVQALSSSLPWARQLATAGGALVITLTAVSARRAWPNANRAGFHLADTYARSLLLDLAEDAVLLTDRWDTYAPCLYLQQVEGLRPDVILVDKELLRRSWYYQYLERRDAALYESIRADAEAFLEAVVPFEADEPYDADLLQRSYLAINDGILRGGPTHRAGYTVLDSPESVSQGWGRVPGVLSFRVYPPGQRPPAFESPAPRLSEPPGIPSASWQNPRALRLEHEFSRYAHARGITHARAGNLQAAETELRRAMRLAPNDPVPLRDLSLLLQRVGRQEEAARVQRRARRLSTGG